MTSRRLKFKKKSGSVVNRFVQAMLTLCMITGSFFFSITPLFAEQSIRITPNDLTLTPGQVGVFTVEGSPEGQIYSQYWESSDESIASIDQDGHVVAIAEGQTVVTYIMNLETSEGIKEIKKDARVVVDHTTGHVIVRPSLVQLEQGQTSKLVATVEPERYKENLEFASQDERIATVDRDGNVTAVGIGHTIIYTKSNNGKALQSNSVYVHVLEAQPQQVIFETEIPTLLRGETRTFTATVLPTFSNQTVTWHSDNLSVATVDATGNVKALQAGKVRIVARSANGVEASKLITVQNSDHDIQITPNKLKLNIGETSRLTLSQLPPFLRYTQIWYSSNRSVAQVDGRGNVTAVGEGEAVITVSIRLQTTTGLKIFKKQVQVKVEDSNIIKISVDHTSLQLESGQSRKVTAKVEPATFDQRVLWQSQNPRIATVDQEGNITAVSPGRTIITAFTDEGVDFVDIPVVVIPSQEDE
jgi:uncharacterized protein YjdB